MIFKERSFKNVTTQYAHSPVVIVAPSISTKLQQSTPRHLARMCQGLKKKFLLEVVNMELLLYYTVHGRPAVLKDATTHSKVLGFS